MYNKGLPSTLKNVQVGVLEEVPNNALSAPRLADYWFIYLGLISLVCNWYLSFCFLELHHHKASNHPIISKLMCLFYL